MQYRSHSDSICVGGLGHHCFMTCTSQVLQHTVEYDGGLAQLSRGQWLQLDAEVYS